MSEPLEPMRPVSVGEDVTPDRRAQLLDAALCLCGIAIGCFVMISDVSPTLRWTIGGSTIVAGVVIHWIVLRRNNRVQ